MQTVYDPRYRRLIEELIGARKDAGFTQAQAAKALRWRRTMISQIENCQRRLDVLEAYTLARFYGVKFRTLEAILDGEAR